MKIKRSIIITLLAALMGVVPVHAQQLDNARNYICVRTWLDGGASAASVSDVDYYDGLGYLSQSLSSHANPQGDVLVRPVVYDAMRRADATSYLPYTSSSGSMSFRPGALAEQSAWYSSRYAGETRAYSNTVYESGPQGRPIETMRPGTIYRSAGRCVTTDYSLNDEADSVRRIGFDPIGFCVMPDGYYPEHSVRRITTTDEDGRGVTEFSDAFGRTLLSRRHEGMDGGGRKCDTYYVYDARDSLVCVIQPEGVPYIDQSVALSSDETSLDVEFLDKYCFTWEYDPWGNVTHSHVPGGATTLYRYDDRDRCVLFADSDMIAHGVSLHMVYDNLDRLTRKEYGYGMNEESFYCITDIQRCSYYREGDSGIPSGLGLDFVPDTIVSANDVREDRCIGSLSYEIVFDCPESSDGEDPDFVRGYVHRAFYYDLKGRLIQTVERGSDGWLSVYSAMYDFVGNVLATLESHTSPSGERDELLSEYTYDLRGRVLSSVCMFNGQRQHHVRYEYDELGRLSGKSFLRVDEESGSLLTAASEHTDIDLRGWTTSTSHEVEGEEIFRQELDYFGEMGGTPMFSGLISATRLIRDGARKAALAYSYDGMGRLSGCERAGFAAILGGRGDIETDIRYDLCGNILSLTRYAEGVFEPTADLRYSYNGNNLVSVTDYAPTYAVIEGSHGHRPLVPQPLTYLYASDCDGRVVHDGRQGLDISYNILNLPSVVTNEDGMDTRYRYLSDGTKRSVSNGDGLVSSTALYLGSFVYDLYTDASDDALDFTELQSVATPEGRLMPSEDGVIDLWYAKDHLGNVRDIVSISDLPQVLEKNDYLPFGTRIVNASAPVLEDNRWRYAGKEEQAALVGSDKCALVDFGARLYDPWTARWTTLDPMAVLSHSFTPLHYCLNNPVSFSDPSGLWVIDQDGMLVEEEGDDVHTLAAFLNLSVNDAQVIIDSQCYKMLSDEVTPSYCSATRSQDSKYAWIGTASLMTSVAKKSADHFNNYTFYIGESHNSRRLYAWKSGWNKGNQYISRRKIHSVSSLANSLYVLNLVANVASLGTDLNDVITIGSYNEESALEGCNIIVDIASFCPYTLPFVILYNTIGPQSIKEYVKLNEYLIGNGLPPVHMIDPN